MIASLRGEVIGIGPDRGVIECQGVGYEFRATPLTLGSLRRGHEATVLTHLAVKEDAVTLYGFTSDEERHMFLLLQTVSGLGPKLALAVLGSLRPEEISLATSHEDAKTLQTGPGVGKRMADRLVVELKDKVKGYLPADSAPPGDFGAPAAPTGVGAQVTEALVGLGFKDAVAAPVVERVLSENPDMSSAEALRESLATLGRG